MQFLIDDEIYLFQEFKFDETGKMHEFKENKDMEYLFHVFYTLIIILHLKKI